MASRKREESHVPEGRAVGRLAVELRTYAGSRATGSVELATGVTWGGAVWRGGVRQVGTNNWRVEATVEQGETDSVAAGLRVEFPQWSGAVYVLVPGAVYGGNRQPSRVVSYSPRLSPQDVVSGRASVIADLPRLSNDGAPGRLQLLAGDCAWPVFAWCDEQRARGGFVAAPSRTAWGEPVFQFTEAGAGGPGVLWVGAPGVREQRYVHMNASAESPDRAERRRAGDSMVMEFEVHEFACSAVSALFERLSAWSASRDWGNIPPSVVGRERAAHAVLEHFERDLWLDQPGLYAVDLPYATSPYQSGWCGGIITQYAMLAAPSVGDQIRRRAMLHLRHVAVNGMAPSGLFCGKWSPRAGWAADYWWEHSSFPWRADWTLTRRQADSLFFGARAASLGHNVPEWSRALFMAAAALARVWEADSDWGYFLNDQTGRLAVGGSMGGGLVPGALAVASELPGGDAQWLRVACAGAEALVQDDLARGVSTGGPGDALLAPDSESIAGLLESLVTLWEITGSRSWLTAATQAAAQLNSWVMPYDYTFPAGSEFDRLGIRSAGTVFANAQNKHSAPGICTHSGWALLRLFRATGKVVWLKLAARIARALPQCVSLPERPIVAQDGRALPAGWINERVNTSDWDNNRGGVFYGPCWSETSLLLTAAELPGVYAQPDRRIVASFDAVEAHWEDTQLCLRNPTQQVARIRVAQESSKIAAQRRLAVGWVARLPVVTILPGGTVTAPALTSF